jgi:hypothetical protein
MTPWQLAKKFQDEHCVATFEDVLGRHLSGGYVWSTPDVFMVAREEHYDEQREELSIDRNAAPNCWFIELAASANHTNPVREFMRVAPWPHKYAAWCRRGEMRVKAFNWNKLIKKIGGH